MIKEVIKGTPLQGEQINEEKSDDKKEGEAQRRGGDVKRGKCG